MATPVKTSVSLPAGYQLCCMEGVDCTGGDLNSGTVMPHETASQKAAEMLYKTMNKLDKPYVVLWQFKKKTNNLILKEVVNGNFLPQNDQSKAFFLGKEVVKPIKDVHSDQLAKNIAKQK